MRLRAGWSLAALLMAANVAAQQPADRSLITVERLYGTRDFAPQSFGPARWLDDSTYTTIEPAAGGKGSDLVAVDAASGRRTVLVAATALIPPGKQDPLDLEDYFWSADHSKLLIFTNSARVWRANTRGDFWVLDLAAKRL